MPWLIPSPEKVRKLKKTETLKKCIQICWRDPSGKILKRSTGTKDYREARRILHEFDSRHPDKHIGQATPTPDVRFSDAAADYIQSKHLKETTLSRYRALEDAFLAYSGDPLLCNITPAMVDEFKSWCRDESVMKTSRGRKVHSNRYSDCSTAMGIIFVKAVLKHAYQRGCLEKDISAQVRPIPKSKIVQKAVRAYSDEELQLLFGAGLHPNVVMCFRGLLFLGCRLGELAQIRWEHVDLRQRAVRIYGTKTNRWRVVPICSGLFTLLTEQANGSQATERVFSMEHGGPVTKHLYFHLAKVRDRYGWQNVNLHSFRHTFIQNHLRAGVDFRTLMRWSGHTDLDSFASYLAQFEPHGKDIDRVDYSFLSGPGDHSLTPNK